MPVAPAVLPVAPAVLPVAPAVLPMGAPRCISPTSILDVEVAQKLQQGPPAAYGDWPAPVIFRQAKIGMLIEVDVGARAVLVASVRKGSEAEQWGVRPGSRLVRLDGRDVGVMGFRECLDVAASVRPLLVHFDDNYDHAPRLTRGDRTPLGSAATTPSSSRYQTYGGD